MYRTHRIAISTLGLVAAIALGGAACSSSESGTPAAAAEAESTTTRPQTAAEQAAAAFQGVQLDITDQTAEPGSTTMFFQDGSWAAMGTWLSKDVWCLAGLYDWAVTDASSPTAFTVRYERTAAFPDCVESPGDEAFEFHVTGAHTSGGRTVFEGEYAYPDGGGFPATRTVCGTTWDHPDRCGVATPGLDVPTPPAV